MVHNSIMTSQVQQKLQTTMEAFDDRIGSYTKDGVKVSNLCIGVMYVSPDTEVHV